MFVFNIIQQSGTQHSDVSNTRAKIRVSCRYRTQTSGHMIRHCLGGLLTHKPPSATVNNSISKCHSIDTQHRPRYSSSEHRLLSLGEEHR
ncbi:uncharacterized protein LOC124373110 isoform X2 [Homalodisca vitripennis]|uniref:uncharacterized protein LOC124373110 isoform X2 n=1 Tax=Homalodisca vitripennis TaxID=197043 RepID=UPI001EEC4E29|nr:uncharacterized protein LOC124373110 isoform X2 [Homalodisca vitripennis]